MAPAEGGTALVVPLISLAGGALFLLTSADRHVAPANVLPLPDTTSRQIKGWLGGDAESGWLPAYMKRNDGTDGNDLWRATMLRVCGELWDTAIGKLWARVQELGVSRITITPAAGLQFLPIHAAARMIGGNCATSSTT